MNDNNTHRKANSLAVGRRGALHADLLGLGGMSLATLLRQRAEASETLPKDTAVIFLFLHGEYLPGIGNGYWSSAWRPPIVTKSGLPNSTLTIEGGRLDVRVTLLRQIDQLRRDVDNLGVMDSVDEFNRTAIEILTADKVQQAFDLSKEDPQLVADYGDEWGQNALVARRLVEAGLSSVTISVPGGVKAMDAPGWDDHDLSSSGHRSGHVFPGRQWPPRRHHDRHTNRGTRIAHAP